MVVNALELLLKQKRFDLIFKYVFLAQQNEFAHNAYLENITAFNNFYELNPSDGVPKNSADDFVQSFNNLIQNIKDNGFKADKGSIPIGKNGDITDGAHRLAASAYLGLDVETVDDTVYDELYDYRFFQQRQMNPDVMDFGALEYVKLNKNAYIVNIHSVTDSKKDAEVEAVLNKYGFIFYKKQVDLTQNGYVNIKKLSYGSFWDRESWIGNVDNKFAGARAHAKASMGKSPLRAFVFVCDDLEKVLLAKSEIRAIFDSGHYSVHINDYREEAIWLAEIYFNKNSLFMINNRPLAFEDGEFDTCIESLKQLTKEHNIPLDNICASGSSPLNVFGVRKSADLDFLCLSDNFDIQTEELSNHEDQLKYYPYAKAEIITNPNNHFYYHGLKFISLDVLYQMKKNRAEKPKDINDCKRIRKIFTQSKRDKMLSQFKKHKNTYKMVRSIIKPIYKTIKKLIN